MKWLMWALAALGLGVVALGGVLAFNTMNYGGKSATIGEVAPPKPPAIDVKAAADMLGAAIRIRTITRENGDPKPGADKEWSDLRALLADRYRSIFMAAPPEEVSGHTLLFTWRGSDPNLKPIILMAHQDVVPVNPGTEGDWKHAPFAGEIADGYIWGRGAMDDKGSLIAILEAADALVKSGFTPKRTVILQFGQDEEVAGAGAGAAFALLKSRGVEPDLVLDEGYGVLANFPLTKKPAALIGVAEKGYVSVEITANTEGGHSSRPPRNSGAVRIANAILALENHQMPADLAAPPFKEMIEGVAGDLPFLTRMAFANQWLFGEMIRAQLSDASANAIVRTTTAPTMLTGSIKDNVLPQRAATVVNFRIHPRDSVAAVLAHVKDATKGIDGLTIAKWSGGIASEPSPVSSTSSDAWKALVAVARNVSDKPVSVVPALVIGATDARQASVISKDAIYRFAPAVYDDADLNGFHGTNERLSVKNLESMIRGYAQIIMLRCG